MLRVEPKQFSMFSAAVYNRIPKDHMLKKPEEVIGFSLINELLADSYCRDFGRPAKEPELLMRKRQIAPALTVGAKTVSSYFC